MQYLRIIKSAIFVSLLEKEKYEAEPGKYLVGFVRWWQLLALLLDINGHFPKITLRKVLGIWLTLISTRIVRSFTASAYNVNLCLIDTIHNGERSTTSVGVSHHRSPDVPLHARGAHLLPHASRGDEFTPLHSSSVQLTVQSWVEPGKYLFFGCD